MVDYRYLEPQHASTAAQIHIEGQAGTILTLLGHRFLTEFYRVVYYSKWGEGIGVFEGNQLIAQAAIAVSSGKFFSEFKTRYLWRVALPVITSVFKNPSIISHVVKGWTYADQARSPEGECDVIFLGVKQEYMRLGVGPELVRYMFGWAGLLGLTSANFMIEKRNRPMRWMIGQLKGLYIANEFEAYGRTMLFYKVPVAPNLSDAKMPVGESHSLAYAFSKNGKG
jgi:ribosomal protein S18 acetylase RimI-like enzyme